MCKYSVVGRENKWHQFVFPSGFFLTETLLHPRWLLCSRDMSDLSLQCCEGHCDFEVLWVIGNLVITPSCLLSSHLAQIISARKVKIKACWWFLSLLLWYDHEVLEKHLLFSPRWMLKHIILISFLEWGLELFHLQGNLYASWGLRGCGLAVSIAPHLIPDIT